MELIKNLTTKKISLAFYSAKKISKYHDNDDSDIPEVNLETKL